MSKIVELFMSLMKSQSSRIASYMFAAFLAGNWVGTYYPKQSLAFWVQPIVALVVAVGTVFATLRNNKTVEAEKVIATFTTPDRAPTEKEAAILTKAGVELPK